MGEELEKIEKKLEELETKKAELYRQKQMLFMKLKSAITLLGQYVEFAEKQDTDFSPLGKESEPVPAHMEKRVGDIATEIIRTLMEINRILGLSKLPSPYDTIPSLPEIDEEVKQVVKTIEQKEADKAFIIERSKK